MRDEEIEKFKAKGFQIVKISNGKAVYVTLNTLDDFDKKSQSPPSQKKKPEYTGRKFKVSTVKAMPNGDLMIAGQKYTKAKGGGHTNKLLGGIASGPTGPQFEDIIMMHFSNDGTLRAAYGVRREENDKDAKSSPNNQLLWVAPDGKLYWTIMEMKGWRSEKELGESKYKYLLYPNVAIVDVLNAKIGDFVQFGQGKTDYYVNNKYPMMPLKGNSEIFFFGETKNGKTLWFSKMPLK
jgi:nucleoside diphosphate kinase